MKRAIVLAGGGTKGAYECGFWRALRELNYDYSIVTGTSIGSINGAMMTAHAYEQCVEMWDSLVMEDMMEDGINLSNKMEDFYNQNKALGPFLKKYVKNKGADISPFSDWIERNISEEEVRKSKVNYGLVTVQFPGLKPYMLQKKDIPEGMLKDYIMASSAIFPVFPMHKIGEETYLDGCYYDNLPIDLAIEMGATDIIAVDLHNTPQHPNYASRPYITYVTPNRDLGGILDFDHERIRKNMEMGYQDGLRTFGKLKGFRYYFTLSGFRSMRKPIERLCQSIAIGESLIMRNSVNRVAKAGDIYRMFHELEDHTGNHTLNKEDYFIRAAEICGEIFEVPWEKIYDIRDFAKELKNRLNTAEAYPDAAIFTKKASRGIYKKLAELKLHNNGVYLTGCLYYAMKNEQIDFENQLGVLSYLPHELAAALFLLAID